MKIRLPASSRRMAASRDRELAGEFFVFLSRFEYALKRTPRYLKGSKSRARPDWERFGADHDREYPAKATDESRARVSAGVVQEE